MYARFVLEKIPDQCLLNKMAVLKIKIKHFYTICFDYSKNFKEKLSGCRFLRLAGP